MTGHAQAKKRKLAVLNIIKDKKEILFGQFSNNLTSRQKIDAWEEVLAKSKSLGLVTAERDWKYVRDTMYGVWKSRSLEKRDNKKKTGTQGGKAIQFDESDEIILDIIGKDTPQMIGLSIGESMDNDTNLYGTIEIESDDVELEPTTSRNVATEQPAASKHTEKPKAKRLRLEKKLKQKLLEKRNLQLQILEKEDLLKTYQLYEMEKKLGLGGSKFTEHLAS